MYSTLLFFRRTSLHFAPASAFLPEHDYGVVLSPYLWGISNTCRVSKRLQKFHRVSTMRFAHCQSSKIVFDVESRGSHVRAILHYTTLHHSYVDHRDVKPWVNGRQLCIGSPNYLMLRLVTTSGSQISYPSPRFPAFRTLPLHRAVWNLCESYFSSFSAVCQLWDIFKSDDHWIATSSLVNIDTVRLPFN